MFPPRLKQTFAFQPFRLFRHSFWGKCNSVSLHFRLLVYKWSPVYPALSGRILHWQMAWSKHLNKALLILSYLASLALPYVAPITAISRFQEYQLSYAQKWSGALMRRWFVTLKSIWGTTGLCRRNPFDFMQSFYTAL